MAQDRKGGLVRPGARQFRSAAIDTEEGKSQDY
jgi:hypothetical protein